MTAQQAKQYNDRRDVEIPISSDEINRTLQRAIAFHGEGRVDEAVLLYEGVLTVAPDNPCANFNLATIFRESHQLIEAIRCYEKTFDQDPENVQVAISLASVYQENNNLDQAVMTYQRAREIDPGQPDIHYHLGLLYHQLGFTEKAMDSFQKTLEFVPEHFPTLYNLGVVCLENQWYEKALTFTKRAHGIVPDDLDCCYNMGLVYFHMGRYQEALCFYEKVFAITPDDARLCNTIGTVYRRLHNFEKAADLYQKAVALKPDFGKACTNLAIVLKILDDTSGAIKHFQKAVSLGHEVESAEHMIAALTGGKTSSVPRTYIKDLFDSYADNFDVSLREGLDYTVPTKLHEVYESLGRTETPENVLDLGCGTGLTGEEFRGKAKKLLGVDLSTKMIEQAKHKGVYDHLYVDDIVDFLKRSEDRYDLIIAADVMVYVGDLKPLFCQISEKIGNDGLFLFSLEEHNGEGYQLCQSGRYAYSQKYIETLAADHGFLVASSRKSRIRKEKDEWLVGILFALQKE